MSRAILRNLAWFGLFVSFITGPAVPFAQAGDVIAFDPDGTAVTNPTSGIQAFDFLPGNSLTQAAIPFAGGGLFNQFYHSRLGSLLLPGDVPVTPIGINSSFEITAVAGFTTIGSAPAAGIVTFELAPPGDQTVNYLELWFDPTPNANHLAGTGFSNEVAGDAVLILRALAVEANGVFFTLPLAPVQYDQAGANNYPGVTTVRGQGSFGVTGQVTFAHPDFFQNLPDTVGFILTDSNTSLPFDSVDPSLLFDGGTVGSSTIGGSFAANVGLVNGIAGPDVQFETDATTTFLIVPEPRSAVLLVLAGIMIFPDRARCRRKRPVDSPAV